MHFKSRIPVLIQLGFKEENLGQLESYLKLLWSSNENLNLISRKMSFEELIDNHVVDCLLPLAHFPRDLQNVADFGSGGGLPGVIYAIQFPHIKFHLYEKSPKKQNFLNQCKTIVSNLEIHGEIPKELKNLDLVMARAFKPLDVTLEVSRSFYENQGQYFLLKGRREKIDEEIVLAQKKFKDLKVDIISLKSPLLEVERHLVLI